MALFSDVDWVIIAAVAAFLLFGKENGQTLRTIGRWYGRAMHLKQELLGEFAKAVDLPVAPNQALSFRSTLLGVDPPATHASGIPVAVRVPPVVPYTPGYEPTLPWTGGYPVPTWSRTAPADPTEREVGR
ncbi:MAG TPA: hypothetical protein VEG42_03480 [Thermoplasmata archaeon]|nr:hypothetical protein [Thermoplasmata archaeon]